VLLTRFVSSACPSGRNLDTFVLNQTAQAAFAPEKRGRRSLKVSWLAQDTPILISKWLGHGIMYMASVCPCAAGFNHALVPVLVHKAHS
jgi:hypothetical protein